MTIAIIFGPTGHVGSAVALSAHSFGATRVILAMRDPSKPIPGLSPTLEASPTRPFQRITADLSVPSTLTTAVKSTSATHAFIYHIFGSPDHMHSALTALKSAGITHVVFLSTGGLRGDLTLTPPDNPIFWAHAQVELNLLAVFGKENFTPVRPGFFATNAFLWKAQVPTGKLRIFAPDMTLDWITPGDIGRVTASVLLQGRKAGDEEAVGIYGPEKISFRDGLGAIVKAVTGREAEIEEVGVEGGVKLYVEGGTPEMLARVLVESFAKLKVLQQEGGDWLPVGEEWEEAGKVVERYTGRPATKLSEWIEEAKGEFK